LAFGFACADSGGDTCGSDGGLGDFWVINSV
jgi:hypothetical protein